MLRDLDVVEHERDAELALDAVDALARVAALAGRVKLLRDLRLELVLLSHFLVDLSIES